MPPKIDLTSDSGDKFDIDQPLWDQSTYIGRWKHFAFITDWRTIIVPEKKLWEAKQLCDNYKAGSAPSDVPMAQLIRAKKLRDSAFHPDTGELMPILGRLSYQLPISVILTTAMITFYKSTTAVVLCQIANQTHNAIINYTNRNAAADDHGDKNTVKCAFVCAVVASSVMAAGCRKMLRCSGPLLKRLVPFCAVVTGHAANLPLMRHKELGNGIPLYAGESENPVMNSRMAAVKGITECFITRIIMPMPCLVFLPLAAQHIRVYCFYQRRPWTKLPIETFICAICCMFMIPSSLAIFPQCNTISPKWLKLRPSEYKQFEANVGDHVGKLYYNKGL